VLLHFMQSSNESRSSAQKQREYDYPDIVSTATDLEARIAESCKMVSTSYGIFKSKAAEQVGGDKLILFFPERVPYC
jgi:hypothetical protein